MARLPASDPRTVARDIPGIFDSIFPQLTPGVVARFNRGARVSQCKPVIAATVDRSSLQKSMLFELATACAEQLLLSQQVDWRRSLEVAVARQRRHFDVQIPFEITEMDREIALDVARNLSAMLNDLAIQRSNGIIVAPTVAGFQWIASGNADFGIGTTLIEVKCSGKNFSASDYRQVVMYWLLSFAASIETNSPEWTEGVLLNPRAARVVEFSFNELLNIISAGRTKVEILQLFTSMIGIRA